MSERSAGPFRIALLSLARCLNAARSVTVAEQVCGRGYVEANGNRRFGTM